MFRNLPVTVKKMAKISFQWSKTRYTPDLTGVPPHKLQLAEFEKLKMEFGEMRLLIKNDIRDAINERDPIRQTVENQLVLLAQKMLRKLDNLQVQNLPTMTSSVNSDSEIDRMDFVDEVMLLEEGLPAGVGPEYERLRSQEINVRSTKIVKDRQ